MRAPIAAPASLIESWTPAPERPTGGAALEQARLREQRRRSALRRRAL